MTNGNGSRQPQTVEQYIQAHPDADPKALLDVLLQQNVRLREEYRLSSEVEIDDRLNFRPKTLAQLQRLARMYAESGLVPQHYTGNIANCAIGVQMALRCKVDILTFLQSSYIVHGKPGIEAKLAIAMLNASGQIKGRIRFKLEGEGKNRKCTAYATDAGSGEEVSQTVDWATVEAEGWLSKSGSKWKTMPDLMFQYRSAMFLIRVYFPDVLMGMYSLDELDDIEQGDPTKAAVPPTRTLDDLADRLMGKETDSEADEAGSTQSSEPHGVATHETPAPDPLLLEDAEAGFKACADLTEVGKFEAECSHRATTDQERSAIAGLAEQTRERIRSTRGTRSNGGKQKDLVTP